MTGRAELRLFHVEFFGDNGSRSWLTSGVLFPFKGTVEELLKDKEGFVKHHVSYYINLCNKSLTNFGLNIVLHIQVQTKSKIFKSLQQALKSGRKNWHLALKEANESMKIPR